MLRGTWAFVLFTLQSKQRVINILLVAVSPFSGCISLGVFFFPFFETVGSHLAQLAVGDSFVDVALCPPPKSNKRGERSDSLFTASRDTYKAHARH